MSVSVVPFVRERRRFLQKMRQRRAARVDPAVRHLRRGVPRELSQAHAVRRARGRLALPALQPCTYLVHVYPDSIFRLLFKYQDMKKTFRRFYWQVSPVWLDRRITLIISETHVLMTYLVYLYLLPTRYDVI